MNAHTSQPTSTFIPVIIDEEDDIQFYSTFFSHWASSSHSRRHPPGPPPEFISSIWIIVNATFRVCLLASMTCCCPELFYYIFVNLSTHFPTNQPTSQHTYRHFRIDCWDRAICIHGHHTHSHTLFNASMWVVKTKKEMFLQCQFFATKPHENPPTTPK